MRLLNRPSIGRYIAVFGLLVATLLGARMLLNYSLLSQLNAMPVWADLALGMTSLTAIAALIVWLQPKQSVVGPIAEHRSPSPLTPRETEILDCVAEGLSNQEIGEKLHIASTTVRTHLRSTFEKLQVGRRTRAVAVARKEGWIR